MDSFVKPSGECRLCAWTTVGTDLAGPSNMLEQLKRLALRGVAPVMAFLSSLKPGERVILAAMLFLALLVGFLIGRRRRGSRGWGLSVIRAPRFQNTGEERVMKLIRNHLPPPDYHLLNHVTLRVDDGTTQVDHILVSRFGVFVIETKDYNGWIFGDAGSAQWTQVYYRRKSRFQNPLRQNYRHVMAVRRELAFLNPDTIRSVVVFTGDAEFKTPVPAHVLMVADLVPYLLSATARTLSQNDLQLAVGKLETARLALSRETDVEHVAYLRKRHGWR